MALWGTIGRSTLRKVTLGELLERSRQFGVASVQRVPLARRLARASHRNCLQPGLQAGDALAAAADVIQAPEAADLRRLFDIQPGNTEQAIIRRAEEVLLGRHDLLGFERLEFGEPPNWFYDPTSGACSPPVHWRELDNDDETLTGNRKVVWELNRHQYLPLLGLAYILTDDNRYASCIATHIEDWIERNPPSIGINWSSSLEIAFRVISWLWTLAFLADKPAWNALPHARIAEALAAQAAHISSFLSTYFSPNTHLTGEALGLYYLGTCVPGLVRSEQWRTTGRNILVEQASRQIRPDGTYFEQATWYQRYTADFYLHYLTIAGRTGDPAPPHLTESLEKQLEVLLWITRPDGTSPYLGDDDGGRLLAIDPRPCTDWRPTLCTGASVFGRGDFKFVAGPPALDTLLLLGKSGTDHYQEIEARAPGDNARGFIDGGLFSMRSGWAADANHLLVSCGPHGVMNCGHAHADALSFDLTAMGSSTLIDPGTYTYSRTDPSRNHFRSAEMHNTVTVQSVAPSVPDERPFRWQKTTDSYTDCWHTGTDFAFFSGHHNGFPELHPESQHRRWILFPAGEYWLVADSLDHLHDREARTHFNFSPQCEVSVDSSDNSLVAVHGNGLLRVCCSDGSGTWMLTPSFASDCFGRKASNTRATCVRRIDGDREVLWLVRPDRPGASVAHCALRYEPGTGLYQIISGLNVDHLAVNRAQGSAEVDGFDLVWTRRPANDSKTAMIIALHGTALQTPEFDLLAERPVGYITARLSPGRLIIRSEANTGLQVRLKTADVQATVNGLELPAGPRGIVVSRSVETADSTRRGDTRFCRWDASR